LADEVVVPPPITKKTLELGTKHSPECVCVPFKYNVGNYIEALEKGANILVQAGGGCRFGFYGEVQKEILTKLGYKFDFIKLNNNYGIYRDIISIKRKDPNLSYFKILKTLFLAYSKLRTLDKVEESIRHNIGFEKNEGEHEKLHQQFLFELDEKNTIRGVYAVRKKYLDLASKIEIEKPDNPIRVGMVGEFYVLLEPFCNFFIEKELAKKGVEVYRHTTFSTIIHDILSFSSGTKKLLKKAHPYLKFHIGAHGTESVGMAHKLIKDGFDGIIHIKPFGCMPEVNAMSALHRLSKDHKVPIIYFSFDAQTSETGIKTRIEAFYDMLSMKRK
jgi:predicted nucleotide-binding protein (sugar kinase/HSP70/actin superfamily)